MEDATVLLFGMPRSGTTWLGKLFDSHPSTLYRHEPDSWTRLEGIPLLASAGDARALAGEVRDFNASLADISALKVCGKTPVFPKTYMSAVHLRVYQAGIRVAQLVGRLGVDLPVLGTPRRLEPGCRLVWKSIESIGRFGLMLESLPNARGVLLIRHPCGYVASVLRGESQQRFQDNRGASEDYGILEMLLGTALAKQRNLSVEYLRSLTPEERLAWRWVLFNDKALGDVRNSRRCRVVRYEDLCADPMHEMQQTFEFIGLDWSAQTEKFIGLSTGQNDSAYYSVFKDPNKAAEKWRDELDADQARRVIEVVTDTAPGSLFVGGSKDDRP